ncbi:MAG: hypothetical protein HBSIN02_11370 [Bacteroidia bacterium]|nr:MAG: hypothetical protein HBSIN02_11370 [Bacteroidia bacterium]
METKELLKKVRQLEIRTRGVVNQVFSGEYHSVFKGRGMEFSEVREYQPGDEIRTIDWNVTARLNHPFVKVFEEERELTVLLLVDLSGSQFFGSQSSFKRDIAVELSAILAFSAMKNNDKVGALLFTDQIERFIPPRKGRIHALRIVRELLSFAPQSPRTSLSAALEYLNRVQKKRAIVFLISDFADTEYEQALRIAGKRHDLVGIVLIDPRERELPPVGLVAFHDAETGQERWVDTLNSAVRHAHATSWASAYSRRQSIFRKSRLDAVEIPIDRSYMKPLTDFFQRRERRW